MTWFLLGFAAGGVVVSGGWLAAIRLATAFYQRQSRPLDYLRGKHG